MLDMDDGEEVILKGSALYDYLHQTGFTNFESYEVQDGNSRWFSPPKQNSECMQIAYPAPQWALDHLNCILKSGLILEDHRQFIECYYPLQVQKNATPFHNYILCGAPFFCCLGGLWKFFRIPPSRSLFIAFLGTCSLFTISCIKQALERRSTSQAINRLSICLIGMEKVFVQLKKMLLLVHQNEFITQNVSLRQREMIALKKKLKEILLGANHKLFNFLDEIKKVRLSVDVDTTLQSLSLEDIHDPLNLMPDECLSLEDLKKLFNTYILLQSEFLRRLALCHCPDIWDQVTPKALFAFSKQHFSEILKWSCSVQQTLIQEQRLFRAILESKNKHSQLKSTSPSWDYSDIYVSVQSASIHFQSLLIQIQGLQDILENEGYGQSKENVALLNTVAHILSEITKEIHSGQACIDTSSVQICKMMNAIQPVDKKVSQPDSVSLMEGDSEGLLDSAVNPPVEDEVFELIVHQEEILASDEDEWDEISAEYNRKKKMDGESSKRVLQELKTVLVKKAEEWKEREKRAMALKGIAYTAPEQVKVDGDSYNVAADINISSHDALLDFLPTNCHNVWPLPRLKGNLQTHRSRGNKAEHSGARSTFRNEMIKSPFNITANTAKEQSDKENQIPKVGFGASLLAEAMAKSKTMHGSRREDIFVGSNDEISDGE